MAFRSACITSYRSEEAFISVKDKVDYLAYGVETCPTTGKIHLQAFAYHGSAKRFTGWQKLFPGDHIEQMKGTFTDNERYCSKQSDLKEFGVRPMDNGKKRSLAEVADLVVTAAEDKVPFYNVFERQDAPALSQYYGGVQKVYDLFVTKRVKAIPLDFAPDVIWIWGPSGTGKSRYVWNLHPDLYRVNPSDRYKWKDGYFGQDVVLFDNVTLTNINPPEFLQEIDRYPIDVPKKGGFVAWRPSKIYITSIYRPDAFVSLFDDSKELIRRLTKVHYINELV